MKPLVSVLIAAYNAGPWLAETVESALAQTWQNIEIILVDDGSQDNTLSVAKRYKSSKVKIIHQDNQGQCAASNRCLQAAQGDFIQYLDADDLLAADKIEQQIGLLKQYPTGFLASGEWARFYHTSQEAVFTPQSLWADFAPVDWLLCAWSNHLMMHGAAWLLPRVVVDQAGPWDTRLSLINDFDYFSRMILASKGVKFCQGARSYYRSGIGNSLSGKKSATAWQSAFLALSKGTDNLLAQDSSDQAQQICANVFQRFIYEVYPDIPDLRKQAEFKVKHLGGATERPMGGPLFQVLMTVLGWKRAKELKNWFYKIGYQNLALGRLLTSP